MEVMGSEVVVAVAQMGRRLAARVEEKVLVDSAAEWRGLAAVAVEDLVGVVVLLAAQRSSAGTTSIPGTSKVR